jgi:VanZ family protein
MKPLDYLEKNSIIPAIITLLIAISIFYVSSQQFAPMQNPQANNLRAISYHFGIFFLLSFFFSISIVKEKRIKILPAATIIGVLYGISDEIHQLFVPGRYFSLQDILINSIGVILASTLYLYTINYRNGRK